MQSKGRLVEWSPYDPTSFVVAGGADLKSYRVLLQRGVQLSGVPPDLVCESDDAQSDRKIRFKLVSVNTRLANVKCLSWSQDPARPHTVAVGLNSGHLLVSSIGATGIVTEFAPRHYRSCNAVAWNPAAPHQVAAGLDKVRIDFSLLIWDLTSGPIQSPRDGHTSDAPAGTDTVTKPTIELGNSEGISSLSWIPQHATCLAAGTSQKWLRIYDLRNVKMPGSVAAHPKTVQGVCFDQCSPSHFATFSEDAVVKVWDLRKFVDPLVHINTGSTVQQICWCPGKPGMLCTISRDDPCIKLWDVNGHTRPADPEAPRGMTKAASGSFLNQMTAGSITLSASFNVPIIKKPTIVRNCPTTYSRVSWHPRLDMHLLAVTASGTPELLAFYNFFPTAFSPAGLAVATGTVAHVSKLQPLSDILCDDVSLRMRRLAALGYGRNIDTNLQLKAHLPAPVHKLWQCMRTAAASSYKGVKELLELGDTCTPRMHSSLFPPVFLSQSREACACLCGWTALGDEPALELVVSQLEEERQFERATALSVFHLNMRRALQTLDLAAREMPDSNFPIVAVAIAGYPGHAAISDAASSTAAPTAQSTASLWKHTIARQTGADANPYIRFLYAFLCGEADDVMEMLESSETIQLSDRIGFACRFINNSALDKLVSNITYKHVTSGDISGILLTGLSHGLPLLKNYLDKTGDVQTVALALSHVPSAKQNKVIFQWIEIYRDLLDTWQLWHERAFLDMANAAADSASPPPSVQLRCNFCNVDLLYSNMEKIAIAPSSFLGAKSSTAMPLHGQQTPCCLGCKNTLPRCSVCLLQMKCAAPSFHTHRKRDHGEAWTMGALPLQEWFTWCQVCRHGGHAGHLLAWFASHQQCPVADCACPCMDL